MIARLVGKLIEKLPPTLLLDVNGVGYEVLAPMSTFFQLPEAGSTVTLYTHLLVREDAHVLCGFIAERDRRLFRELIKVNGIGAKSALAILSSLDVDTLMRCVQDGDIKMLCQAPGIGKKTAERLIIELRDKLKKSNVQGHSGVTYHLDEPSERTAQTDAIDALVALGYKAADVTKITDKLVRETPAISSEAMIRAVLKQAVG